MNKQNVPPSRNDPAAPIKKRIETDAFREEALFLYDIDDPQRFGSRDLVDSLIDRHIRMRSMQARNGTNLHEMAQLALAMSSDYLLSGMSQQAWANRVRPFGFGYAQYMKLLQLARLLESGYFADWQKTFANASMTVLFDALPVFQHAQYLEKQGESGSARMLAAFIERFLQSPYATQENLHTLRKAGLLEKWPALFKGMQGDSNSDFLSSIFPGIDGEDEPPSDDSPFVRFVALMTSGLDDLSMIEERTTTEIAAAGAVRRASTSNRTKKRDVAKNDDDDDDGDDEKTHVIQTWHRNAYAVEEMPRAVVTVAEESEYCTITISSAPMSLLPVLSRFVRLYDEHGRRIDVESV